MNAKEKPRIVKRHPELASLLFQQCRSRFEGSHLPSHDHFHHLRVWNYTMDLISELPEQAEEFNENEILLLMLSVFFHDTGLTVTLDEEHGTESRRICQEFLDANPKLFTIDAGPALRAIELHDKKQSMLSHSDSEMEILKILSVCDDLDAYGPTGILRYAEIYLLRGVAINNLPEKVLKNMAYRFDFFSAQNWIPENFYLKHRGRYRYAAEYYKELQDDMISGEKQGINQVIIESYMDEVYHGKKPFLEFAVALFNNNNEKIRNFGSELLRELNQNGDCQTLWSGINA